VKWWDVEKGFGFVCVDGEAKDVFCHFSKIEMDGRKNLREGQEVELEFEPTRKGLSATRVVPL
jgi:CspA family cold shock protein